MTQACTRGFNCEKIAMDLSQIDRMILMRKMHYGRAPRRLFVRSWGNAVPFVQWHWNGAIQCSVRYAVFCAGRNPLGHHYTLIGSGDTSILLERPRGGQDISPGHFPCVAFAKCVSLLRAKWGKRKTEPKMGSPMSPWSSLAPPLGNPMRHDQIFPMRLTRILCGTVTRRGELSTTSSAGFRCRRSNGISHNRSAREVPRACGSVKSRSHVHP